MYVAKLKVFKDRLHSQNSPLCTTSSVGDFLLKKFNDGSAPSTIEGYRTAIADAYPEMSLSLEPSISRLIQSFHRGRHKATPTLCPVRAFKSLSGPYLSLAG